MVEIFKTDVQGLIAADMLVRSLCRRFPSYRINFDLEDCDRILRVEGVQVDNNEFVQAMRDSGYRCTALED